MTKLGGRHGKAPHIAYAKANGWELERRGGGHYVARRIDDAGTSHMFFVASTPGGNRSKENTLAKFVKCDKGRCQCHLRHGVLSRAVG
jgi:hypothetical protein